MRKPSRKKLRHVGKNRNRWRSNPLEKAFAKAWIQLNTDYPSFLKSMLDVDRPDFFDDWLLATAIQWLGSPVGQDFLEEILNTKAGKAFLTSIGYTKVKRAASKTIYTPSY